MLILNRKEGERVVIGKNIYVEVLDIRGNQVRLGFEAPPEVTVHREEIRDRIDAGNGKIEQVKDLCDEER